MDNIMTKVKAMDILKFSWRNVLPEMFIHICRYLGFGDLQEVRSACKTWHDITRIEIIKKSKFNINVFNMRILQDIIQNDDEFSSRLACDSVDINGVQMSDSLEPILKSLAPKIRKLCFYKSPIVNVLNECLQVEELTIRDVFKVRCDDLVSLDISKFKNLKSLVIEGFMDFSLVENIMRKVSLEENLKLEKLCIVLDPLPEKTLNVLRFHSASLKHLEISFCCSDVYILEWAKTFAMFTNLEVLKIRGIRCKSLLGSIMSALPKETPLRHISLIGAWDLKGLIETIVRKWSGSLVSVELLDCHSLTNEDIKDLMILCPTLRKLIINICSDISVDGILQGIASKTNNILKFLVYGTYISFFDYTVNLQTLVQRLPHLTYLSLGPSIVSFDDTVLSYIFRCLLRLQHLHLVGCMHITDKGLLGFGINPAPISNLKGLQTLTLRSCPNITDIALTQDFQFNELRRVDFSYCNKISSIGITNVVDNCPSLEVISILGCRFIDQDCVQYIIETTPRLKRLHASSCVPTTNYVHLRVR